LKRNPIEGPFVSRGEMLDDLLARSELAGHLQPSGKQKLSLPNIGALYAEHFEHLHQNR
jgi:hypothetical protein